MNHKKYWIAKNGKGRILLHTLSESKQGIVTHFIRRYKRHYTLKQLRDDGISMVSCDLQFPPNVKEHLPPRSCSKNKQDRFRRLGVSSCWAFFIFSLGGICYGVKEILEGNAHLLKFLLYCLLIFSGERVWGSEFGVAHLKKSVEQTCKLPLMYPRNIVTNSDAFATNRVSVITVKLPEMHGMLLTRLDSIIAHPRLEPSATICCLPISAEPMPKPETKQSGKDRWKNGLGQNVHWVACLVTGGVCLVIGWVAGVLGYDFKQLVERRFIRPNVKEHAPALATQDAETGGDK